MLFLGARELRNAGCGLIYLPGVGVKMGVVSGVGADFTGVGAGEAVGEFSGLGEGDGLAFAVLPFVRA